ncbi:FtsQ-type POTRA domain-containing protein [Myxococcota bacterium]|nr:FtsQ-type POTRA domain-containing protein [Myxococcota bacterium]
MNDLLPSRPSPWKRAARVLAAGVLGGAVVTALGVGAHHVDQDAAFRVYQVEIVGAQRAPIAHLRHLADVPVGAHLALADLDQVRRGVERHPWVARANVSRVFPSTIRVEVTEHQPVMLLALDQLWYVDDAGRPIKVASSDDLDFPVLTGLSPDLERARPELAAAVVLGAIRLWRACDGQPVAPSDVSEIHHDPHAGYEVVLRSGSRILVGHEDPAPAMARLRRLVSHGLDLGKPQQVDVAATALAVASPLPPLHPPPAPPAVPDPAGAAPAVALP